MKEHQHNGIWRIEPSPLSSVVKRWGLYYNGREVANRSEDSLHQLIKIGPVWIKSSSDYKNTDSVYLLLPWEFME